MDAVKFFEEAKRMCDRFGDCEECPLKPENSIACKLSFCLIGIDNHETMVAIVEKWASEHPVKTRQSEFLKMFPNAKIDNGCICICPKDADATLHAKLCVPFCKTCLREYWLAEV